MLEAGRKEKRGCTVATVHDVDRSRQELTVEEAFAATFEFLNSYWEELREATVADVLSEMNPAYGGRSSDPALWHDFQLTAEKVRERR